MEKAVWKPMLVPFIWLSYVSEENLVLCSTWLVKDAWECMSAAAFTTQQRDGVLEIFIEVKTLQGHRLSRKECWQGHVLSLFLECGASAHVPIPWNATKKHLWYVPGSKMCLCSRFAALLIIKFRLPTYMSWFHGQSGELAECTSYWILKEQLQEE